MIPKYQLNRLEPGLAGALRKHLGLAGFERVTSPAEAAEFLLSRQIASLWGGVELPSLYEARGGELAPSTAPVESASLATMWVWARNLVQENEFILLKLFRGRATFVARPLWPLLLRLSPGDSEAGGRASDLSMAARQLALFLREHGPASTLELEQSLPRRVPMLPASLRRALEELEERLIIYPQWVGEDAGSKRASAWALLRPSLEKYAAPGGASAVAGLTEAVVRSAGIIDPQEAGRWFPLWKRECRNALSALVRAGKLRTLKHSRLLVWHDLAKRALQAA